MATSDVTALQRSDLNNFLFADVGMEANGMALSVVSIFARQGSDPWQEAGRLARLPKAAAIDILARMIAGMPESPWTLPDATAIAARLTGLLPTRSTKSAGPPSQAKAAKWSTKQIAVVVVCIALAVGYGLFGMLQTRPDSNGATVSSVPSGSTH